MEKVTGWAWHSFTGSFLVNSFHFSLTFSLVGAMQRDVLPNVPGCRRGMLMFLWRSLLDSAFCCSVLEDGVSYVAWREEVHPLSEGGNSSSQQHFPSQDPLVFVTSVNLPFFAEWRICWLGWTEPIRNVSGEFPTPFLNVHHREHEGSSMMELHVPCLGHGRDIWPHDSDGGTVLLYQLCFVHLFKASSDFFAICFYVTTVISTNKTLSTNKALYHLCSLSASERDQGNHFKATRAADWACSLNYRHFCVLF